MFPSPHPRILTLFASDKGFLISALSFLDFVNSKEGNPKNRAVIVCEASETVKKGDVIRYEIDPLMDKDGVTTIRLYVSTGVNE